MRAIVFLGLCILLNACAGWQPVHLTTKETASPDNRLAQIDLTPVYSIIDQNMYNALLDRLDKYGNKSEKKYNLTYGIAISTKSQSTLSDGSASVILRRYTVNYTLAHGKKKQTFTSTTATTVSNDNSPFNNSLLAEKADEQAVNVLTDTIMRRLSVFLRSNPDW